MFDRLSLLLLVILCIPTSALAVTREDFRRPLFIPFPQDKPYSPQRATLGKMLFFDPRLSGAQNMSCASCHNPSFGWEVPTEGPVGAHNEMLGRQAPTVLNMSWGDLYFWDGRAATLEEQARGPITAPVEMNANFADIIARLEAIGTYRRHFERAYPGAGISEATILNAIATYERTIVSGWTPFDRWVDGDETAISPAATRGFEVFVERGQCAQCHSGWNFTDNGFHDIGLKTDDEGRAAVTPEDPQAKHAFKTPSLRNIAYRSPFMHNGSLAEMEDVIMHYISGGIDRPSLSEEMNSLDLTPQDISDLLAFLNALTADESAVPTPLLPTE